MILGQNDEATGGLGDRFAEIRAEPAHHHAADEDGWVVRGRTAGQFDRFGEGDPDRYADRDRIRDRAGYREKLLRHRLRLGDIERRFDVDDDGADRQGNLARRDDLAGHVVNQHELVTGWVTVAQLLDSHAFRQLRPNGFDDVRVLALDADDRLFGTDQLGGDLQPFDHLLGIGLEDLLVLV